jgi:hypothetical protein
MLLVEIQRGLGAVHRRLGNSEAALNHFKRGRKLLKGKGVPPHVRADFLYSYGYFLFEDAVKQPLQSCEWTLTSAKTEKLQAARKIFEDCIELDSEHPAANARLEIVKKLLGDFDLRRWIRSRALCRKYTAGEPVLTAFLCGFAIRLHQLTQSSTHNVGLTSEQLYYELAHVFEEWPNGIPLGPIHCHWFDTLVVKWDADIERDLWLKRAFELLQTSARWKAREDGVLSESQLHGLREFEESRNIKRCSSE